jgi:hypothetical protein
MKKILSIGFIAIVLFTAQTQKAFGQTASVTVFDTLVSDPFLYLYPQNTTNIDYAATTTVVFGSTSIDILTSSIAGTIAEAIRSLGSDVTFTQNGDLDCITPAMLCGPWHISIPNNIGMVSGNLSMTSLSQNDDLLVAYGPLTRISATATSTFETMPFAVTAESFDISSQTWSPAPGVTISVLDGSNATTTTSVTNSDGVARFRIQDIGNYTATLGTSLASTTVPFTVETFSGNKAAFRIRTIDSGILFEDLLDLPAVGTTTIDSNEVNAQSVSSILSTITTNPTSILTFASSSSIYLSSMDLSGTILSQWFHSINGIISDITANEIVNNGDDVRFFDSTPYQTTLSETATTTDTTVTATFKKFDVSNIETQNYIIDPSINVGAALSTSSAYTEVSTTTTDGSGIASFIFNAPGTYSIARNGDYANGAMLTISLPVVAPTSTGTSTTATSTATTTSTTFSREFASTFIIGNRATSTTEQKEWNAIAFSVIADSEIPPSNLAAFNAEKAYFASFLRTAALAGTEPRDIARRIMALLAVGENPYTAGSTNQVDALVATFNGTHFGSGPVTHLTILDDAYALFALKQAGYAMNESMMQITLASIKGGLHINGSLNNSLDETAVVLEALSLESTTSTEAINAQNYITSLQDNSTAGWGTYLEATTARVMFALNSVNVFANDLVKNSTNPLEYLAGQQNGDGSVGPTNTLADRISASGLSIIASEEKSLDTIITDGTKPVAATTTTPSTSTGSSSGRSSNRAASSAPASTPNQDILRFVETRTGLNATTMIYVGKAPTAPRPTISTPKRTIVVLAPTSPIKEKLAIATSTPSTTKEVNNIAAVGAADTQGFFTTLGLRIRNGFRMLFGSPLHR